MASGFQNSISFSLLELNWGEMLNGLIDEKAVSEAVYETLDELEAIIEEHFADRESSWKALAASTIKDRLRIGYQAGPILGRSGTLRENVARNKQVEINGTEIIATVSPAEVTAPYSNVPITEYAAALDEVRPFYDISDEEAEKLFDILEEKIAEKLGFI